MLITNNGTAPVTMNLRDGTSYLLRPGVPTSVPDSATTMIDDSSVLIALFNAGTLTVTTDAGGAFTGFPTVVNATDSAQGKLLPVRAKVGNGGARTLVDEAGQPVGGGGRYIETARQILRLSEAAASNNARVNPVIPSYELVSIAYYADAAAANTAFAAAANTGKAAYIGTAASYQIAVSNGTAYVPTTGCFAYYRAVEPATTGYVETRPMTEYGFTTAADFGGKAVAGKINMLGWIGGTGRAPGVALDNDTYLQSALLNRAGTTMDLRGSRVRIRTSETQVMVTCNGYSGTYILRANVGGRWAYISDAALSVTTADGVPRYYAGRTNPNGGNIRVLWDFSALGQQYVEFEYEAAFSFAATRFWTRPNKQFGECTPSRLTGLWLCDSLGNSAVLGGPEDTYPHWLREYLNTPDLYVFSDAGSGFVADSAGNTRTHIMKAQALFAFPQMPTPHLIAMAASVNDGATATATLQAAISDCVTYCLSKAPNALVLVVGPTAAADTTNQALMLAMDQMLAAFVPTLGMPNVLHIPTMSARTGQPITGNKTIQTADGAGTSEYYFNNTDTTHFVTRGHARWARDVLLPGILSVLRKLVGQ